MYVEVDFGRLQNASSVVVESSDDIGRRQGSSWKAWAPTAHGSRLSDHPVQSRQPIRASLRLAATAELKARGIHYLLIKPDNPGADDLRRYPAFWGLDRGRLGGRRSAVSH